MKLKCCFIFSVLLFTIVSGNAQDKNSPAFNKITPEDFILRASPAIDSSSNAVIIADLGITTFKGNSQGWVSYIFKRKTRIKILNKNAFDLATVKIHLYTDGESRETLDNFSAVCYNLENGLVVPTKMEKKDLFTDKIDKNIIEQKFTLPGVKEESIIEYSYTVNSDFYFNIPEWEFQSRNYPCLWSEYQVTIPSLVGYVFTKRGVHPFFIDKASDGHESYLLRSKRDGSRMDADQSFSITANTVKHRWVMKDMPAFFVESYLSSPDNYIDKIDFQLSQTYDGEATHNVMNSWKKVTEDLLKDNTFAAFMTAEEGRDYWLEKALQGIVKNNMDQLEQAKAIYYYLTNNFTCTGYQNKYIKTTLQDVYKSRKGNVGEINLLFTNMLLKKGITAAPVLLSTRAFGYNYPSYPILGRLNYVICKATINDRVYYLDASHPQLGFGYLPPDCYNGHARVISNADSASVYFMADSIKERQLSAARIFNDTSGNGILRGTYEYSPGYMESYAIREAIQSVGEKKYFTGLQSAAGDEMQITTTKVDSLKKIEEPLAVQADFIFKMQSADIIYFNPVLWVDFKTNPFHAAVRKYPVEMPYPVNQVYLLTMEVPAGYAVDEIPKSARVSFNDGEGMFEYLVQQGNGIIQLRSKVTMKRASFEPAEYNTLRDFFAYVVKKQNEQIVFKRK
ncbi:MAG: transglutaminase-like domain-containing protein [Chitinophagaceae bacterium]